MLAAPRRPDGRGAYLCRIRRLQMGAAVVHAVVSLLFVGNHSLVSEVAVPGSWSHHVLRPDNRSLRKYPDDGMDADRSLQSMHSVQYLAWNMCLARDLWVGIVGETQNADIQALAAAKRQMTREMTTNEPMKAS